MPTRKWGSEKLVNATIAGVQSASQVAVLAGGGYVVVWQDDGVIPPTIRFQRFDAVGNKVGTEGEIGSAFSGTDIEPSVTGLAGGGFYITWSNTSFSHIEGHVYDAGGNFVRYQPVVFNITPQRDSDGAAVGTGSAVAWTDPGGSLDPDTEVLSSDILYRSFDAAGTGGAVILVTDDGNDATDEEPAIASNGSRVAVVWASRPFFGPDYNILCRILNPNGTAITAQFGVAANTALEQRAPDVAWLASNRIAIVWRDNNNIGPSIDTDIKLRILDQNGNALTGDILVNETTLNAQSMPAITTLPNGNFVVSWTDASQTAPDTNGTAVRLQAFGASGSKIGGEIVVNTTTTSSQAAPSVTALADSRVVVTWTDTSSDAGSIRSQIVDPRDGIVNGGNGADTLYGHDAVGDEINGANGNDVAYGLKGNDTIYGGEGDDDLYGGRGDDTLYGGANADVLTGDLGDDDLFGEDGNDDLRGGAGADGLDGGAGIDIANYTAALASVTAALDASLAGTGDAAGDTFDAVEDIRGANVAGAGDVLRGDGLANSLTGNAGNDTLNGRANNDKLIGGLGADTLTGELGNDQFIYNATIEGGDFITDFSSVSDLFRLRGSGFGGLPTGTLAASSFVSRGDNVAQDSNDFFIFRTTDQTLWFDLDGNGAVGPLLIADLQAGATMTNLDISIF